MSMFLWHTIVDTEANRLRVADEDNNDLYKPRFDWSYRGRNFNRADNDYGWISRWPRSRMTMGDPSDDLILGVESSEGGRFEPLNFSDTGSSRMYFIHGVVVDGSGTPLAGAVLDLFLTASDTLVTTGGTDSNGIYSLGTPYTGQQHYIVANYGPNTLVGASVNTLTPVTSPW